jgi:hypothetical protein
MAFNGRARRCLRRDDSNRSLRHLLGFGPTSFSYHAVPVRQAAQQISVDSKSRLASERT